MASRSTMNAWVGLSVSPKGVRAATASLLCMLLTLASGCVASHTSSPNAHAAAPSSGQVAAAHQTRPGAETTVALQPASLSSHEEAELERIVAAASFEQVPHSQCSAHTPWGLWTDRVTGRHPVPNEAELDALGKMVDSEPLAVQLRARGYFELWQWALRDVLSDALKPELRKPEETRALHVRLIHSSNKARSALERAIATPLPHAEEYAFQLALLLARSGRFDLASARLDVLLASANKKPPVDDPAVSSRASLLRAMMQLATLPTEPSRALAILEHSASRRVASGTTASNPISLATDCYRPELLVDMGDTDRAVKTLKNLASSDERLGFSTRARTRLNELTSPSSN